MQTERIYSSKKNRKQESDMMNMGKIPPQATELEEAVLGALMLEKNAIIEVLDILTKECFYKDSHSVIFDAITTLFAENEPIDLLTVTNKLRKKGNLENAGGAFYLTELTDKVSSSSNIQYHSRIIYENYLKREIIAISSNSTKSAFEDTTDVFELIGSIESGLIKISRGSKSGNIFNGYSLVLDSVERIKLASTKPDGLTGIPSGYKVVDELTGGWQNSDLIILAARPSMGKTDLGINICLNASNRGFKTALFSLEMSKEQLMDRALAIDCEIDRNSIKFGKMSEDEWDRIGKVNKSTFENFIIADEPMLTTLSFKSQARRLKLQQNISMIVVDYLQLMHSLEKGSTNDRVSDISRTLKLTAKELNIPIIAISQLSRDVEKRGGAKRPMLSDLRDSGAIEQDADIIIFPYRPIYYGIKERSDGTDCRQLMELDIAKNRSGAVDIVDLKYLGKFGKVVNVGYDPVEVEQIYNTHKFNNGTKTPF